MERTDFYVMAIFALLIFAIGLTFTKAGSKNGQAFFEAGGATPWWINGLSLFISYFSAGTFVVWGSIAYKSGLVANVIQLTMAISGFLVARFIAGKWKQTGAMTAADYLGRRFGVKTQQFYTYLILLLSLFSTAAVLYPVGKMVHVATLFPLNTCIIVIGLIIVLYTAAGGLWAVLVTDVVQFVILSASVFIVIPIAFSEIGGVSEFFKRAPSGFFQPFNADYTFEFMLAFVVYQLFYIGGNWAYVQRYTSVATVKESKKVAYLFTILYLVSPIIWMLPPMIYRIINPNLQGLEPEGAYMMICQKVLPAGLIGLVLAGMISATSSKANTTINLVATVFANDIYKPLLRPKSSDKELILMARLFTLLFGAATIIVAILIPRAGGVVEVVLSTASIAGGALFGPIIWSLFTRRQTASSLVTISVVSLLVSLFFKVVTPSLFDLKFNRTVETIVGVGLPVLLLLAFELYSKLNDKLGPDYMKAPVETTGTQTIAEHAASQRQNVFGVRVISISMAVIGIGVIVLGILAPRFSGIVSGVGLFILVMAAMIWYKIRVTKPVPA
ncbi:sodium:solute symporter family protein [Pedobacter metabolipauper]|uniref:SSS family transporter n=1 Tax=Pedobacter metabolipauper TaxID=425513 RepID=A0A4R6SRX4_9SPHI|nr:sodium:solute symporter family protein [Pedobacter metabolipauper]TDQ07150.1 SSS family transporter [Pedobacter metabolipauper]